MVDFLLAIAIGFAVIVMLVTLYFWDDDYLP